MRCHNIEENQYNPKGEEKNILLMGNPNVGKSVLFSKMTGMEVMTANYTGTTVSFTQGKLKGHESKYNVIDVPGTYSLEATSQAEEVAIQMLEKGADAVVCVIDATNLERNLDLIFQVQSFGIPIVYALNLTDVAERQGISIDVEKLSEMLGGKIISTVAVKNIGVEQLVQLAVMATDVQASPKKEISPKKDRWAKATEIAQAVQVETDVEESWLDKLGDATMKPWPGGLIAFFVLIASLGVVVGGGKALRGAILLPLVNNYIVPALTHFVSLFIDEGILRQVLVGEFGILVKGIEWPFALIMPYVLLFYIVISFLEDSGYLPRLGVLVDGSLRKLGLPGGNIVPFIMGYGCAVPAILGTRASNTYKERLILSSMIALAVPCTAQSGAFFVLLGESSVVVLIAVYLVSFLAIILTGVVMNRMIKGQSAPMLLEVPNLLLPSKDALGKKIWIRMKHFLFEAEVPMLIGIAIAALVVETGFLDTIGSALEPLVVTWLGLPAEASLALMLGIIRRELAVMPLIEMNLTTLQMVVGSVVALFYLPCLSVFAVLIKEFKLKMASIISLSTIAIAFLVGGLINQAALLFTRFLN